jgi:hypothetical protein
MSDRAKYTPNIYFEGDSKLNILQQLTESKLGDPKKFDDRDIKNLISLYFVNKTYLKLVEQKGLEGRDEAIEITAAITCEQGTKISQELQQNKSSAQDIGKISGKTMSEIMQKITEYLAGKSGEDLQNAIVNVGAMIGILLKTPELQNKFNDAISILIDKSPIVAADIKDYLDQTNISKSFADFLDKNLTKDQKINLTSVNKNQVLELRDSYSKNTAEQKSSRSP